MTEAWVSFARLARWKEELTVTVGVEMMHEQAVATTFDARSFRATSSGQGCADVVATLPNGTGVDGVAALAPRLPLAAAAVMVTVVNSVAVEVARTVVSIVVVLFAVSRLFRRNVLEQLTR